MLKLIRYLKQVKWQVLAIVLLLVVQAWCDLSLPQYTSDIVDVGIQQGGIEHAAPDQLRDETMEGLKLFMEEDDWNKVEAAYTLGEDGIWYLDSVNESTLEELDEVFGMPMLMLSAAVTQKSPPEPRVTLPVPPFTEMLAPAPEKVTILPWAVEICLTAGSMDTPWFPWVFPERAEIT